jgi:hypothetical protein
VPAFPPTTATGSGGGGSSGSRFATPAAIIAVAVIVIIIVIVVIIVAVVIAIAIGGDIADGVVVILFIAISISIARTQCPSAFVHMSWPRRSDAERHLLITVRHRYTPVGQCYSHVCPQLPSIQKAKEKVMVCTDAKWPQCSTVRCCRQVEQGRVVGVARLIDEIKREYATELGLSVIIGRKVEAQ